MLPLLSVPDSLLSSSNDYTGTIIFIDPQVKTRRYDSPRRRAQAAATRQAILDAARRLFERDGYTATSVPDIAAEAGVALKTVYVIFETKVGLLRAVWEARFGGEEEAVPVFERAWFLAVAEERDPERKLRLFAAQALRVKTGSGALLESIRNASFTDSEIATLWDDIETKLLDVARSIVIQLSDGGALAADLSIADATDILWTLNHPTVWHLTVRARRWTPERYERCLGDVLCTQLLGPST